MIKINLAKAKAIAHNIRREKREEEFKPLDSQIAKQIPGDNIEVLESGREKIREKYNKMQSSIDKAKTINALQKALK